MTEYTSARVLENSTDPAAPTEINQAAALVTCTVGGVRHVLLIERADGWAMPGGAVESGESPASTAWRELCEQTDLWIADVIGPNSVTLDLPRGGLVVARCDLGEVDALPAVRGGDDARRAEWFEIFWGVPGVPIFPAHREILGALR